MPAQISVFESPDRGRHLVASEGLPAGCLLLSSSPFEAVLYDDQVSQRCATTFTAGHSLLRCSRCRLARYSSREAQHAAWIGGHRAECSALRACAPKVPPATVRLAARVLWKSQGHQEQEPAGGTYEELQQLQPHWSSLPDDRKQSFAQMAALTREYMDGAEDQAPNAIHQDVRGIAMLIARFACNNHTICDEELRPIGTGIYPRAALANHSCTPNAVQSFQGSRIMFRSIRPIQAGEEICISYLELTGTHAERRAALLSGYHFDIAGQEFLLTAAAPLASLDFLGQGNCQVHMRLHAAAPCTSDEADGLKLGLEVAGKPMRSSNGAMATMRPLPAAPMEEAGPEASFHLSAQDHQGPALGDAPQQARWVSVDIWGPNWTGENAAVEQAQKLADAASILFIGQLQAEALLAADDPQKGLQTASDSAAAAAAGQAMGPVLGAHHVLRMRLQEVLLRCAIACGAWPVALQAARSLTGTYQLLYPPVWPNLGLHRAIHAKVAMHQQLPAKALEQGRAAVTCLELVQPGSEPLREIEDLCRQAQHELGP